MTEEKKKSIENLVKLFSYFERHSTESAAWQKEFDISSQIRNLILSKTELVSTDFQNIANIFNKINDDVHFDGSGWQDFKIRLNYLLRAFGYHVTLDSKGKRIETFERIQM